ncbi:dephospho-CoA kinase [Raineyella antarctica]|uniref:Dephospho-CoA kinase n=1 Tax=Raineyella antarctica TaxID=1577474 RepID=A0A1G6GEC8_9ACTN|nr:dephospho-CoA kinase [Raineyella antarctica]SDB80105.1 dephospho-CoA kinase [Raineyella antarctica]
MLRIGLTGGIGSGKSTVAALLAARGAVVLDADRIARAVVEPGTPGLAAIRERFGDRVVGADGALDRAALGAIVFADPAERRALEAITHPLIRERTAALVDAAAPEAVVIHDIPLLVEIGAAPTYHLVVVVDVDAEERVRRLVASRGMAQSDARARIGHQASRAERLAVADVVLDNNGTASDLEAQVDRLWQRLVEFDRRLRTGEPYAGDGRPVPPDPTWADQAGRTLARLADRLGRLLEVAPALQHVGPTAVPGVSAPDVLHLQVGLPAGTDLDRPDLRTVLEGLGHPRRAADPDAGDERVHLSCDPDRPVVICLRQVDSPGWRDSLLARDWLRADGAARADLEVAIRTAGAGDAGPGAARPGAVPSPDGFPAGWWEAVRDRARDWADATGRRY